MCCAVLCCSVLFCAVLCRAVAGRCAVAGCYAALNCAALRSALCKQVAAVAWRGPSGTVRPAVMRAARTLSLPPLPAGLHMAGCSLVHLQVHLEHGLPPPPQHAALLLHPARHTQQAAPVRWAGRAGCPTDWPQRARRQRGAHAQLHASALRAAGCAGMPADGVCALARALCRAFTTCAPGHRAQPLQRMSAGSHTALEPRGSMRGPTWWQLPPCG